MNNLFKIGLIVKPQGIRGEVKVQPLTDNLERFLNLKEVLIDGQEYKILNSRLGDGCVFVALYGVADRNDAELMRGKFLCVTRENAVVLPPDRYFIADIIGCDVFTQENEKIGNVTDLTEAKTDIFTVKTVDGRVMRFPFLKDAVTQVDVENKKIIVSLKRLTEVCVYED